MKKNKIISSLLALSLLASSMISNTFTVPVYAAEETKDNGMKIDKTARANNDGSYTITLEAYATGEKITNVVNKDVPTDIVLVIDQSGSMKEDIGEPQYSQYNAWESNNNNYYEKRHNGGGANLWHKLDDGSCVSVSVTKTQDYKELGNLVNYESSWGSITDDCYYYYANNLYEKVGDEYKKVDLTYQSIGWRDFKYIYTFSNGDIVTSEGNNSKPDFGNHAPLYTPAPDGNTTVYTYTYTDKTGTVHTIGTSTGVNTTYSPAFYKKTIVKSGTTRISALRAAVTTFANSVADKAKGTDEILGTQDDVKHRIAVVGYAGNQSYYTWKNTEVFVGGTTYKYGDNAKGQYSSAFQDMSTSKGQSNIAASIAKFKTEGPTYTQYGLEMANGILGANQVPKDETRNRVVILFTDGYPGQNANNFDKDAAEAALNQADIAKNSGVTLYSIGIFEGADATTKGDFNGSNTQAANWFMQQVSSNNGEPQASSYYLSAGDAESLNNIFKQIAENIEQGGSDVELDSSTVIKDTISEYFQLPDNADKDSIKLKKQSYVGENTWGNLEDATKAEAEIEKDSNGNQVVKVTGFNFKENWCGTETNADGNTTYRGNKLVISFNVVPKPGFLGGNKVPTNALAGVYEKANDKEPMFKFREPKVDVPIKKIKVTAEDKNVYLKGGVTAEELKKGLTIEAYDENNNNDKVYIDLSKPNYGLESWQNKFVTINISDKDGKEIADITDLNEDSTYTVSVKVSPRYKGDATEESSNGSGNINVFKPELTFKDGEAYYGEDATATNFAGNKVGEDVWKHGDTLSTLDGVTMIGTQPTLNLEYAPDTTKLAENKYYTKQNLPVKATVKIGETDVTNKTTFVHQACSQECGWTAPDSTKPGDPAFLMHIKTCQLTITKTGGAANEPYVFTVKKDDTKYTEVTVVGNTSVTISELPVGTYTIEEDTGWSWRYKSTIDGPATLKSDFPTGTLTCTNEKKTDKWLNEFSAVVKNIFGQKNN